MNNATTPTQYDTDFAYFAHELLWASEDAEFAYGRITPMLRYVAGLTYRTTRLREAYVNACVFRGYNRKTAETCWATGRKFMRDLEKEDPQ